MAVIDNDASPAVNAPEIDINVRVKERGLAAKIRLKAGFTTAIIGPNGAGKTTLLDVLAGVLRPDDVAITSDGAPLASANTFVPAHSRGMSFLTQDSLLFPHLNVVENVAFAPRSHRVAKKDAHHRALAVLDILDVAHLANRRPHQLSGGQAQRVALARALVTNPRVLLLDEPLAALDSHSAPALRQAVKQHAKGRTVALVTHDLLDVLTLAEQLVVLDGGEVVESGPTAHLLAHPRSDFLAGFLGVNVVRGWLRDENLTVDREHVIRGLRSPHAEASTAVEQRGQGRDGWATFSPDAPTIHVRESQVNGSSARNHFPVRIESLESRGPLSRVWCTFGGQRVAADVTATSVAEMGLEPGQKILLSIKATAVTLY